MLSCTNHNSGNDEITEETEVLVDTAYFGSYHYVANIDQLGETHLYFTFSDFGIEGKAFAKDKNQAFRIDPVLHIAGFVNLKLVKSQTITDDLTFYDYLFNFEYKYLRESLVKTNFYSKDTEIRTDAIISKVE
jgi:hypothetical protein